MIGARHALQRDAHPLLNGRRGKSPKRFPGIARRATCCMIETALRRSVQSASWEMGIREV